MPKYWIVALAVVIAVGAGVVAFAVVSSDDGDGVATSPASSDGSTSVGSSTETTSGSATTSDPFAATSDASGGSTTTVEGSTTTVGAATTTTEPCPEPSGSIEPIDTGLGAELLLLESVDVTAADRCTDAVEFDFREAGGEEPGVTVAYREPPFTEDGSGEPIDVAGSAFVELVFEPAATFDFLTGELSYTGPEEIVAANTRYVREVSLAGAFEGTVRWIVGLDEQRPFDLEVTSGTATLSFD